MNRETAITTESTAMTGQSGKLRRRRRRRGGVRPAEGGWTDTRAGASVLGVERRVSCGARSRCEVERCVSCGVRSRCEVERRVSCGACSRCEVERRVSCGARSRCEVERRVSCGVRSCCDVERCVFPAERRGDGSGCFRWEPPLAMADSDLSCVDTGSIANLEQ